MAALRSPVALAVVGLTVLGALLRFTRIGHQGFWFDEGNTALLVGFSPGKMLGLIPQTESTPPLYYLLAWFWTQVFGHGEAGLRSFSALAGVAVIPVAYGAAAKLVSRRAGLIVAALAACNPFLIWYSQEARSYSLLVLFSSCALLAFAYARADPRPRPLALWVLACALALTTHYYAVVVVVPQAAWLLWEHRRTRAVLIALGAIGLCGLALIPLAISQSGTGNDSWIARSPLGVRLRQIIPQFLIGTNAPERQLLKFIAFALAALGLAMLVWARAVGSRGGISGEIRGGIRGGIGGGAPRGADRGRPRSRRVRARLAVRRGRHRHADHPQHHRAMVAGRRGRRRRPVGDRRRSATASARGRRRPPDCA